MATSSECNQAIVDPEQRNCPSEPLIADCNEARPDRQSATIELIKTQVTNAIAASDSCLNGLTNLNGTKITGKLVAVRKDGTSYTFTTTTASAVSGGSPAKTFTLATPTSKGGSTLITVAKPQQHLTLSGGQTTGATVLSATSPPQRLYYNKTTNTIEHSIASLNQGTTQDDLQSASTAKINTSKPIILQMKRKIQVLDENRKTARIFTIPSSANLINKQSNQFIVMNRAPPKSASLLANGGSIKDKMASLAKPITGNLSVLDRASLSISNSISNASKAASATKLKPATLGTTGEPAASITIVSKPISNSTTLLNKLAITTEHLVDNKIKPKLDAKPSIESQMPGRAVESFGRPAGYLSTIEQSACLPNLAENNSASNLLDTSDGDNKIVKVDAAENLLGEEEEALDNDGDAAANGIELAEETVEELVECYDFPIGSLQHGFAPDAPARRTTMENLIESTIESSFESSSAKVAAGKDTCVDPKSVNNAPNCIKQDIEFNPNSIRSNGLARERSVSLGSLTNGACPPAQQFSMQT